MACYNHQQAHCVRLCQRRYEARHHAGALLGLLAVLLSLVAPVVHMSEVGAAPGMAVSSLFSVLARPLSGAHSAVFTSSSCVTQSLPHDAALCAVCQGLSRLRHWLLTPIYVMVAPAANNWQAPQTASFSVVYFLSTRTPRAPPVLSYPRFFTS